MHLIHKVLGTPPKSVLERFAQHSTHMTFDFPPQNFVGFDAQLSHVSKDAIDLLYRLLAYDPELRISAEDALRHAYFREFWDMESAAPNLNLKALRDAPRPKAQL